MKCNSIVLKIHDKGEERVTHRPLINNYDKPMEVIRVFKWN